MFIICILVSNLTWEGDLFWKLTKCDNLEIPLFIMGSRAKWLKEPNPEAEDLFRMVAEVFIYWSKSHVSRKILLTIVI